MKHTSGEGIDDRGTDKSSDPSDHVTEKLLTALEHMKHPSGEDIDDRGPGESSDAQLTLGRSC
jgi:hypothetical protein